MLDRMFVLADGDGDGAVGRDEFERMAHELEEGGGALARAFSAADADGSGVVDRAEFESALGGITATTTCTLTPVNSAAAQLVNGRPLGRTQQGSCAVATGRGTCEYYSNAGSSPVCDFTPRLEAVDAVVCELDFSKVSEADQPVDGSCSNFDARGCSCTAASIANGCTYVPAWPSKRKYTDGAIVACHKYRTTADATLTLVLRLCAPQRCTGRSRP